MLDYKFDFPPAAGIRRYPSSGTDVLIIGGGIGGLFAAVNCWQKGHDVRILEAGTRYDRINGGFIRISGSVSHHLDHLPGVLEGLEQINQDPVFQMFGCKGERVSPPKKMPAGAGVPYAAVSVHRAALQRLLFEYARHLGIEVRFDTKVSIYFEDVEKKKGGIKTPDGEQYEGDIVIAADGIGSRSVDLVENEGSEGEAQNSGIAIFRANYPAELAYKKPNVVDRFSKRPLPANGHMQVWSAANGYAIINTTDELINFHICRPNKAGAKERWDHKTNKNAIISYLDQDGWGPDVRDLVEACPDEALFDWKLMFRNPKPNWVSPHGYVVQLGDAAHTFLPSSGNGATQAMEDGTSLASCLHLAGKAQVPLAARVYNKLRFERTSCAQKLGFRNRDRFMAADIETLKAKQVLLGPIMGMWVTQHDAEAYVYDNYARCVDHLVMGKRFENTNIPPGHIYKPWTMHDFLSGNADWTKETGDWR